MSQSNTSEHTSSRASNKIFVLGLIGAFLYFGLFLVQFLIAERQNTRQQVIRGVAASTGGPQHILGPVIHAQCRETWNLGKSKNVASHDFELLVPATSLDLDIKTQVEPRQRGIYSTHIHNSKAQIKARWDGLDQTLKAKAQNANSQIRCGSPHLALSIEDPAGIRQANIQWSEQALKTKSGSQLSAYPQGLHAVLPESIWNFSSSQSATIELDLAGIERLDVVPLADSTEMKMSSHWPHPSFGGRFAPIERNVSSAGFEASWKVSSLASNAVSGFFNKQRLCQANEDYGNASNDCIGVMRVAFVDPVNFYSLSDRAAKYGLLFVVLTFIAVGMFEVMKSLRVHPMQYLLVGAAICCFFLLLVSLSEHIGFDKAYASASLATVLLLTYYASHILGSFKRGLPFGLLIATLYALLYALLQLEQTALVVGSVALFIVLAALMVMTRKVNWYGMSAQTSVSQA